MFGTRVGKHTDIYNENIYVILICQRFCKIADDPGPKQGGKAIQVNFDIVKEAVAIFLQKFSQKYCFPFAYTYSCQQNQTEPIAERCMIDIPFSLPTLQLNNSLPI